MRDQARVVVIGGGIVGCSVLYHLAKLGWSDVMLVEKTELTAGSTWHAAGLLPLFNMSYSVGQLHKYSIDLYQQLEEETGQAVSFHRTGNLRLATNQERMDEYRNYCGTANTIGVPFELIGPNEIGDLWPLCNLDGLVGALFHPSRRPRCTGGRNASIGQRRPRPGRGDQPQHRGDGHRTDPCRRLAGQDDAR